MYYIYSMKIPTCILYYLPISYYNPVEIKLSTLKCKTCSWHYAFMSTWCNSPILLSSQWQKTREKTSCCQIMVDWLWKIQKSDDSNIIIHNSESRWIQNYGLWESSKFQISRNRIRISNFRIMDLEKTVFGFIISSEPLARMLVLCFRRRRLSLPCRSATSSLCSGVRCSSWTLPLVNTKHGQL
jgi:hypothetical protein